MVTNNISLVREKNRYRLTREEIIKWCKKRGRTRAKILLVLSDGELGITVLSRLLERNTKNVWTTLKKMEIDGLVKNSDRKWHITLRGIYQLKNLQKIDRIPIRNNNF